MKYSNEALSRSVNEYQFYSVFLFRVCLICVVLAMQLAVRNIIICDKSSHILTVSLSANILYHVLVLVSLFIFLMFITFL